MSRRHRGGLSHSATHSAVPNFVHPIARPNSPMAAGQCEPGTHHFAEPGYSNGVESTRPTFKGRPPCRSRSARVSGFFPGCG